MSHVTFGTLYDDIAGDPGRVVKPLREYTQTLIEYEVVEDPDAPSMVGRKFSITHANWDQQYAPQAAPLPPPVTGATVTKVVGDNQTGPAGTKLAARIGIQVMDNGVPVTGAPVTWAANDGGVLTMLPTSPATDENGISKVEWTLGPATGAQSLTATASGVTVTFAATAAAAGPTPVPTPTPTPTPVGTLIGQDFRKISSLAELSAGFTDPNQVNVFVDPGNGIVYRFIARPTHCADQSIGINAVIPNRSEIWIEFEHTFPANWKTTNPNCATGNPDYKHMLVHTSPKPASGGLRCDWKVGVGPSGSKIHCAGDGFSSFDQAPMAGVVQVTQPWDAQALADGKPHRYRLHLRYLVENGVNKTIAQAMIDGQVTHSYKDVGNPARDPNATFRAIDLGANRNLGAIEEMLTVWHSFHVYDTDPGWFAGVPITDYS